MVWGCCVPGCKINAKCVGMSLFTFRLRDKEEWRKALGFKTTRDVSNLKVCSRHFQENDMYMAGSLRRLRKNAIPNLNIHPQIEQILISEEYEHTSHTKQLSEVDLNKKCTDLQKQLMEEKEENEHLKKKLVNYSAMVLENKTLKEKVATYTSKVDELKTTKNKISFKMDNFPLLNFEKICRTCLSESEQMLSIFAELREGNQMIPIVKILKNVSFIKKQVNDGLPSQICKKCIGMALTSFNFQKQCKWSQSILDVNVNLHLQNKLNTEDECLIKEENVVEIQQTDQKPDNLSLTGVVVENDPLEIDTDDVISDSQVEMPQEQNSEHLDTLNVCQSNINDNGDQIQNEEKRYRCSLCEKSYKYAYSLQVHMRNHTGDAPYTCKVCNKSFKQHTSLVNHKRSHSREQPFECKLCGKRYKQSGTLTAHMRIHTGQKPFLCSICGKGFRQSSDLNYHIRIHSNVKPFMCNICGKMMSMQSHLVQHMRTHTGERPYKCSLCEKAFPSSTRLRRHVIIHTNLRPYACEVCSKTFNRRSSLKVHSKVHTDERAHVCPICSKGYIQAHALKSHLMSHSSEVVCSSASRLIVT